MRITRPGGTDLTVELGEYPTMIQYGFAESPGRFDHWGAGHVHTFPNEGSANGTVVFSPGDIVVLPYCRYVQDEVRLDIRDGFIRMDRRRPRRQADARLARRQQGASRRYGRPRDLASRLGAQSAGPLGRDRAQRRRPDAPSRRRPLLRRQFPVLHRPELAGRRQAHDQGALRRADARLHRGARQRRHHRARQDHRREDAGRVRAALDTR